MSIERGAMVGQLQELKIGRSFLQGRDGGGQQQQQKGGGKRRGVSAAVPEFHAIRYDFKPASVDLVGNGGGGNAGGSLTVAEDNSCRAVTVTLPNAAEASGQTTYGGHIKVSSKKDAILIIDHETGEITLEMLSGQILVKKIRPEKPELSSEKTIVSSNNCDRGQSRSSSPVDQLARQVTATKIRSYHSSRNSSPKGSPSRAAVVAVVRSTTDSSSSRSHNSSPSGGNSSKLGGRGGGGSSEMAKTSAESRAAAIVSNTTKLIYNNTTSSLVGAGKLMESSPSEDSTSDSDDDDSDFENVPAAAPPPPSPLPTFPDKIHSSPSMPSDIMEMLLLPQPPPTSSSSGPPPRLPAVVPRASLPPPQRVAPVPQILNDDLQLSDTDDDMEDVEEL